LISEFFRVEQGVEQISSEPDCNQEPDESFSHRGLLESVALARIKRREKEHARSEGKKDDIEHRVSPGI
jgi:hypothetical protein